MNKENLIQTCTELFLKYGIKSVSMDDISRKLGISKKTIYEFVENKNALVHEVMTNHIKLEEEAISCIKKQSKNALEEILGITEFLLVFLKMMKPTLIYDLAKYHKSSYNYLQSKHFKYIEDTIKNNMIRGIKEGIYRSDIDPSILSKLYVAKTQMLINEDLFPSREYHKADIYQEAVIHHLYGIINKVNYSKLEQRIKKLNK